MTGRRLPIVVALAWALAVRASAAPPPKAAEPGESGPFAADPLGDPVRAGKAADYAAAVTVLTYDDLVALGAHNLAEALAYATGTTATAGRVDARLQERAASVRGLTPAATRIRVDGVPVGESDGGVVDLTNLPLDNVAEVRIVRGAVSALSGGDTAGGVIDVITRKATRRLGLRSSAEYGSGNAFDFRVGLGGVDEWFSGYVSGSHQQADGWVLPASFKPTRVERGALLDNAASRRDHYFGKVGFALGPHADLAVEGGYFQGERDVPVDVNDPAPRYYRYPSWRRWNAALLVGANAGTWFRASARAFYDEQDQKLAQFLDAAYDDPVDSQLRRADLAGGDLALAFDFGRWSLVTLRGSFRYDATALDLSGSRPEGFAAARQSHALQWEMNPVPQLFLLAGASYDLFEGLRSARGKTGSDLQQVSPLGSVTYAPIEPLAITLSYARKCRVPTLDELYVGSGADFRLRSEVSDLYELIVRGTAAGIFRGRLSAFQQDLTGVVRTINPGTRAFRLANEGTVRVRGAEMEGEVTPTPGLRLRVGYTWMTAQEVWRRASSWTMSFIPEHRGYLDARYVLPIGLGFGYWAQVVSAQQYHDAEQEGTLAAYTVHNLRFSYRYHDRVEAFVAMTNLADARYQTMRGYPEPGRAFHGGVEVQF